MKTKPSLFLRILTIVLLSLTAARTLLGAIGTTCVAFQAENFGPRMAALSIASAKRGGSSRLAVRRPSFATTWAGMSRQ